MCSNEFTSNHLRSNFFKKTNLLFNDISLLNLHVYSKQINEYGTKYRSLWSCILVLTPIITGLWTGSPSPLQPFVDFRRLKGFRPAYFTTFRTPFDFDVKISVIVWLFPLLGATVVDIHVWLPLLGAPLDVPTCDLIWKYKGR